MVTIKDIAKIANVSHTTVSRALNNSPLIKKVTSDKIKAIAKELNYSPNFNAKSLVLKKSYMIGLFFSSIDRGTSSSFLSQIVKSITDVIDTNYQLAVNSIDTLENYEFVNRQRYDGIIIMSQSEDDNDFIYYIKNTGIPFVVLNRNLDDSTITNVISDDQNGACLAVEYLIELGHRNIAIIEGEKSFKSATERREGFIQAMIKHNIPISQANFISGDYSSESGFVAMNRLLQNEHTPTAVFCSNDDMAIGALNACYAKRIRVPEEISIVGFDDICYSNYTSPPLTTVNRPMAEISKQGIQALISLIEDNELEPKTSVIVSTLKIRESAAKLDN